LAEWNNADLWDVIAAAQPDAPALIQDERVINWRDFSAQADSLAAAMIAAGVSRQSKVATYLYNDPEYLIASYAAFKAGLAPFNVNYRYGPEELFYLLDNADAEVVVFDVVFAAKLDPIRGRLPKVRLWVSVGEGAPDWSTAFEDVVATEVAGPVYAPCGRSGDDLLIIYTGGTTGMPKGVMWRQADIHGASKYGANPVLGLPPLDRPDAAGERAAAIGQPGALIASPLMHATGLISAFATLCNGGAVTLLPSHKFDAVELWEEAERTGVVSISIVGLAFCTPMLEALDAHPGRWTLPKLRVIGSSGAMWSFENKQGLLRNLPHIALSDRFASSEAFGMGASTSTAGGESQTAQFTVGETCAVFNEAGERVQPGSGERGRVAVGGPIPLGYYNDPAKTAATFPTFEGQRWSMPGDWATVDANGLLTLLGRGSQCINTGGEKVFPEEVEEALKRHPAIRDAAVVGIPEARFGEVICALIEPAPGAGPLSLDEVKAWVRNQLADYKAPRSVIWVDSVGRAPNGKLDYQAVKIRALAAP
jgi:acyl-CoA synthetase (AMP-forming)/AMP-acid ligase II